MEFKYNGIYSTTMFTTSEKLDKLDSTCVDLSYEHDVHKQYELIKKARQLCIEIVNGYNECTSLSQRMLNTRVPISQSRDIPGYMKSLMRSLKEAREELIQERLECSANELEKLAEKTKNELNRLEKINAKTYKKDMFNFATPSEEAAK